MAKYVLAYTGGRMAATDEERQAAMAAWGAFLGGLGESLVDAGNPFGVHRYWKSGYFATLGDELIDRIVANTGVDRSVAAKAVGIILDFLLKEGPPEKVQSLVDALPGATEAVQAARAESGGGGVFSGMGGIMGVGTRLMGIGLGMDQIRNVTREVIGYAREKAGDAAVSLAQDAVGIRRIEIGQRHLAAEGRLHRADLEHHGRGHLVGFGHFKGLTAGNQYVGIVERFPNLLFRGRDALAVIHLHVGTSTPLGISLASPPLDGGFGQDRHRDLLRRDGAEIEPGRRLEAVDRLRRRTAGDELFA